MGAHRGDRSAEYRGMEHRGLCAQVAHLHAERGADHPLQDLSPADLQALSLAQSPLP